MWMELSMDYWSTHGQENICFSLLICMPRSHSCQTVVVWIYPLCEWHQMWCQHMYVTLLQRIFLHTKSVQVILFPKGWSKDFEVMLIQTHFDIKCEKLLLCSHSHDIINAHNKLVFVSLVSVYFIEIPLMDYIIIIWTDVGSLVLLMLFCRA
jgi:hypothetical protein